MSSTYDFGHGPVPATRRANGAWVADSAIVSAYASIGASARIGAYASIGDDSRIGASSYGEGRVLAYGWCSWVHRDGARWLRYGCEMRPLAEWTPAAIVEMCIHHVDSDPRYVRALPNLVAYVSTLDNAPDEIAKLNADHAAWIAEVEKARANGAK